MASEMRANQASRVCGLGLTLPSKGKEKPGKQTVFAPTGNAVKDFETVKTGVFEKGEI